VKPLHAAALADATISQITVMNGPGQPVDETDTTLLAHLAAGTSMGQTALTALTGPATRAQVTIVGYRDTATVTLPAARGSKLKVECVEVSVSNPTGTNFAATVASNTDAVTEMPYVPQSKLSTK
jgi:hypothetical protein